MSSQREINEYLKRLKDDERCLGEFFNAVSGYVKYVAYRYLVDKSYVSDVVTNTFYRIINSIQTFDDKQNGMSWIYKITQNEAYAINIRERKHAHVSLDEIMDDVASTVDLTDQLEFTEALERSLNKLPEQDRRMVEMRIFEGATYQEVADTFGMYVGTAYKRIQSAIKIILKDISR